MTWAHDLRGWLPPALGFLCIGCALDRGAGFSTLEAAHLEVSLVSDADQTGADAAWVTDRSYTIVVQRAVMQIARVELYELDDSNSEPPESEASDHEHGEGDHDEAPSPAASSALVTLGFEQPISMIAYEAVAADSYAPSRELAKSSPGGVRVALEQLELEGTVSGGDFADATAALVVDLPLELVLEANLEPLEIDRDGPESVHLETSVLVGNDLFDGLDFAALAERGSVVIDDPDASAAVVLETSLAASETHATLE